MCGDDSCSWPWNVVPRAFDADELARVELGVEALDVVEELWR